MYSKAVPFSSSRLPVCLVLYVTSGMSEPKTQTFPLLSPRVGETVRHQNCLRTAGSSDSSPQPAKQYFSPITAAERQVEWTLVNVCSFTAFPVGGPNQGVHYTPSRFRRQCPLRRLWLLTCHITNITFIFRAAGGKIWKTVTKVGVAPLRCPNTLRFLVFDSETADEPLSHAKPRHVAFCGKL